MKSVTFKFCVTLEFWRHQWNLKPKRFDFCIKYKPIDRTCPFHYQRLELSGLLEEIGIKSSVAFFKYVFMHVYSPGPGADNPLVAKFWCQQKAQITLTICSNFQNDLFEFWFYTHFLIILYMYIAPGQGQTNPWGQQKALTTSTICCKFQKSLFEFWFYTHFLMFFHMYIALGQEKTLFGQNSDVNRKASSLYPFVASFKKISLKSDFIHIFACFYTRI